MIDLAKAPASGAGPGVESPRLDYRKSATHLHPYVSALSDGRDRFRVGPSSWQQAQTWTNTPRRALVFVRKAHLN